jgi:CHAD domain-containing protein
VLVRSRALPQTVVVGAHGSALGKVRWNDVLQEVLTDLPEADRKAKEVGKHYYS